jgi:hypothetical protein
MQVHISYITKVEFFAAFKNAFITSFNKVNIQEDFRETNLILFNSETVISKLNIAFYMLIFTNPPTVITEL